VDILDTISMYLRDAEKYSLAPEVVLFALKYMKANSDKDIEDAISYGYWEWCK